MCNWKQTVLRLYSNPFLKSRWNCLYKKQKLCCCCVRRIMFWDKGSLLKAAQKELVFSYTLLNLRCCLKLAASIQGRENTISEFTTHWNLSSTAAEDKIGCHSCQLRTGKWSYNSHGLTKIGQYKIRKTLPKSDKCQLQLWHSGSRIWCQNLM